MKALVLLALALGLLVALNVWGANPGIKGANPAFEVRARSLGSHPLFHGMRYTVRSLRSKMKMGRAQIEMMQVDLMVCCIRNARNHGANLFAQIAASFAGFRFTHPLPIAGGARIIADQEGLLAAASFGANGKAPDVRVGASDHKLAERDGEDPFPGRTKGRSAGWRVTDCPKQSVQARQRAARRSRSPRWQMCWQARQVACRPTGHDARANV